METAQKEREHDVEERDDQNLFFAETRDSADDLLAEFYGKYPWPWQTRTFHRLTDPDFETLMINQDIGDWTHGTVPRNPKVWVAGCGTNQAIITALKFPNGTVVGSDLSKTSLELCERNAGKLGISNLTLRNESLNEVCYENEFDFIVCTGVIHHNANPGSPLAALARALRPDGVLELMVYNRYHRIITSVFQKAIRILCGKGAEIDFAADLEMAKRLLMNFPANNLPAVYLSRFRDQEDSSIADALINPVEHTYTVESLAELAGDCGLEIVAPYISIYDQLAESFSWNLKFNDSELQKTYDALADLDRWQVSNLVLFDNSPLLWFYFQKAGRGRKSERQICKEFLDARFVRNSTRQQIFALQEDNSYRLSSDAVAYPRPLSDPALKSIRDAADGTASMREIFLRLGIRLNFATINQARLKLTTSAYPYLKAVDFRTP